MPPRLPVSDTPHVMSQKIAILEDAVANSVQNYTGSGAPAAGLGNTGDVYEDTATGSIYRKLSTGVWA